jgi:hypothetical protein
MTINKEKKTSKTQIRFGKLSKALRDNLQRRSSNKKENTKPSQIDKLEDKNGHNEIS